MIGGIAMPVDIETRRALDLKNLPQVPGLPVIGLEVEDYTDWEGEPALRVTVILDESVDPEKVSGKAVSDLNFAIHENLTSRGITLFPYIFLVKPSELAETAED